MATKSVNKTTTQLVDPLTGRLNLIGNQTGTPVNATTTDMKNRYSISLPGTNKAAPAATTAQTAATGLGQNIGSALIPSTSTSNANAVANGKAKFDAAKGNTQTSQTGPTTVYVGGTGQPAVDPVMAQYANYVAESYARSQPGERPAWNDQWQPQIDALQGGRYGDYQSPYQAKLDGLLDRILGRPDFNYNWSDDPLYRQYAARYQQQARQGMQDAMGQAAGLTGGYGSSYATAAGSQAYGQQMQGLNDRAMELYQLAKDRYDTQGADMRANMGLLEQREAANRGMYQDDRDTWYGRQDADIANLRNSQLMGWNVYQDAADREMAERQMAWDQYQYWNGIYEAMREQAKKSGGGGGGGRVAASTGTTGTTANSLLSTYRNALAAIKGKTADTVNPTIAPLTEPIIKKK